MCGTAAVGGGVTPAGLVVVGVCGFGGYAGDQIAGWLDTDSVPVAPIVFVPPPEDEQTSTKSSTTWQDDPPPPQGQGQDPSSGQQNTPTETGPSGEGDAGGSGSGGSGDLPATTGQATVVVEAAAAKVRLRLAVEDDLAAARCDAHVCQQWVARADSQAQPVVRWRPLGQAFLWPPPTGGNRRGVMRFSFSQENWMLPIGQAQPPWATRFPMSASGNCSYRPGSLIVPGHRNAVQPSRRTPAVIRLAQPC